MDKSVNEINMDTRKNVILPKKCKLCGKEVMHWEHNCREENVIKCDATVWAYD